MRYQTTPPPRNSSLNASHGDACRRTKHKTFLPKDVSIWPAAAENEEKATPHRCFPSVLAAHAFTSYLNSLIMKFTSFICMALLSTSVAFSPSGPSRERSPPPPSPFEGGERPRSWKITFLIDMIFYRPVSMFCRGPFARSQQTRTLKPQQFALPPPCSEGSGRRSDLFSLLSLSSGPPSLSQPPFSSTSVIPVNPLFSSPPPPS